MRCVSERQIKNVTVLDLAGRAMLGELNTAITQKVESLLAQGRQAFLLNLSAVTSVDSNALGDLVGACETAARQGGALKLFKVHERVAHTLRVMNLSKHIESFETEEEALRSFEQRTSQ